jgi:hypothetical protein
LAVGLAVQPARCTRRVQLGEFTDDPSAPARVLTREPKRRNPPRRPPVDAVPRTSTVLRQAGDATPAGWCRTDEERPACSAQYLAGRSKEDAVTLIERGRDLAAKHAAVAEHHDLKLELT